MTLSSGDYGSVDNEITVILEQVSKELKALYKIISLSNWCEVLGLIPTSKKINNKNKTKQQSKNKQTKQKPVRKP